MLDRLERLIDEAVRAGRFNSRAAFLKEARMSSGYLAEFRERLKRNPNSSMKLETARACAQLLGTSVSAFTGDETEEPPVLDIYPGRAWAINAARSLKLPEAAIQLVLKERPADDPGALFWFRRIEAEAQRVSPAPVIPSETVDSSRGNKRRR